MATEEIIFLRDQVQRLNAALAEYQDRYPPLGLARQDLDAVPDTPWVTDKNLMSPLLTEYDANIQLMRDQVNAYKAEQKDLRSQVDKLVAENNRLTRELKSVVERELLSSPLADVDIATPPGEQSDDQVLRNLQVQLQMALQEKDHAMEMWQASVQEVDRLERDLQCQQLNPRLQALEHQAGQIKGQYVQTVGELNNEITSLQEELRQSKNELKVSSYQVNELKTMLQDLRLEMAKQEQEKTVATGDKHMTENRLGELQRHSMDTQTRMQTAERSLALAERDKKALEEHMVSLQKKGAEQEAAAYEAALQVRDSVQMAESAMLEKDQALVRERQTTEEVERLQAAISSLLDEAGARTRKEVDGVRQLCNQNINKLMEEIHGLELESSEKQAQTDRALREKRAVEAELEKIYQEGLAQGNKDTNTYDELTRRACNAERTRDEALLKVDGIQNEMQRLEMTLKQDKSHLGSEVETVKDRLAMMNREFELANEDRVKLTETIDELKKKAIQLTKEKDGAQRTLTKEVSCRDRSAALKQQEYEAKVQANDDSHRHALTEMRKMLTAQQRMSAKWKEECETVTHKFEGRLSDVREEAGREKKRAADVTKLLKDSRDKTMEVEQMVIEYTKHIKRLEERVRESEGLASTVANTQPGGRGVHPHRDIVEERRRLQRELERSLRETKAAAMSGRDPLAGSDLLPGAGLVNGATDNLMAR